MKIALLLSAALSATAIAAPTVEPSGVRVIREVYGEGFEGLKPFNAQKKGSALALIVKPAGGGAIIKLEPRDAALEYFTDDKGTDLLVEKTGFQKDGFSPFARVAEDGGAAFVEIEGGGLPVEGASALKAKGTLVVQTASTKKPFKSAPVELKPGVAFKVGDIELKVKETGEPDFGDHKFQVEFETNDRAIERVAEVTFLNAGGEVLESQSAGGSSMGFGNRWTFGRNYSLEAKPAGKVVVQFDIWTDFEEAKVPFEVAVGLGG